MAQSAALPTGDQEVTGWITGWILSFVEIGHEIFSMDILPLLLIQEEQLSFCGTRMCTSTG